MISFGNLVGGNREYRIVGSFQFEKGRVGTADVLTIAMAGVALEKWNTTAAAYQAIGLDDIQGVLLVNPRGNSGVALTLSGLLRASGNGFTAGGRLGVVLNTSTADLSGTNAVDVDVNGTIVRLTAGAGATGAPYFAVNASDVSFDFGGLLEISGDFSIDSNGSFRGSNLTVFVGKGPSTDPGAIGLKITNASVEFHRFADGTFVLIVGAGSPWSASTACGSAARSTSRSTPAPPTAGPGPHRHRPVRRRTPRSAQSCASTSAACTSASPASSTSAACCRSAASPTAPSTCRWPTPRSSWPSAARASSS